MGRESSERDDGRAVLQLRWVLIIATSYLLLSGQPLKATPPVVVFFIVAYLSSNVLAGALAARLRSWRAFEIGVVVFDATAVSVALLLSQGSRGDFFLLYVVVLLIGTLTDRLLLIIGTATLLSALDLYVTGHQAGIDHIVTSDHLIRIPFLFVVALFFGHLIQRARFAERLAVELRERERAHRDFVGGVVHDLKNTVGAIRSSAEMMLEGEGPSLPPEHADLARGIHSAAHRLLCLSVNLLDAARIESGRLTLQREPAAIAEVVEKTIAATRVLSDLRQVSVSFVETDHAPKVVDVDVVQMDRVLWNLLDNAIRHTPPGGTVRVSSNRETDRVVLTVLDEGSGIAADRMPKLFEQYNSYRPGQFGSTGLGLFIVKAIVEAHGGTVSVANGPEGGARFEVRLPAVALRQTTFSPTAISIATHEPRPMVKAEANGNAVS